MRHSNSILNQIILIKNGACVLPDKRDHSVPRYSVSVGRGKGDEVGVSAERSEVSIDVSVPTNIDIITHVDLFSPAIEDAHFVIVICAVNNYWFEFLINSIWNKCIWNVNQWSVLNACNIAVCDLSSIPAIWQAKAKSSLHYITEVPIEIHEIS